MLHEGELFSRVLSQEMIGRRATTPNAAEQRRMSERSKAAEKVPNRSPLKLPAQSQRCSDQAQTLSTRLSPLETVMGSSSIVTARNAGHISTHLQLEAVRERAQDTIGSDIRRDPKMYGSGRRDLDPSL